MAVELLIADGDPYWASTSIWVVPGSDPNGSIGPPLVGQPAFLWARVSNSGSTPVTNARVNFCWANPSTVVNPENCTMVGMSYVTLAAGESKPVLCVTPWIPVWVNNGHECLIVEAFHPSDPITRGAGEPFSARTDRHVAQKNVGVLQP
jgi:hypothetical protein